MCQFHAGHVDITVTPDGIIRRVETAGHCPLGTDPGTCRGCPLARCPALAPDTPIIMEAVRHALATGKEARIRCTINGRRRIALAAPAGRRGARIRVYQHKQT